MNPEEERRDWQAEQEQQAVDNLTRKIVFDDALLARAVREYHDDMNVTVPEAIERYAKRIVEQLYRVNDEARSEHKAAMRQQF